MFVVRTLTCRGCCNQQLRPVRFISTTADRFQAVENHRLFRALRHQQILQRSASTKWGSPNVVKSHIPDEPLPPVPYHEYIWSNAVKWENAIAVICGATGQKLTYKELRQVASKFGAALRRDLGLKADDRLAVLLPNCPEYIAVALGAMKAGVIPTPMNPIYTSDEIAHQLVDSGAVAAITIPQLLPALQKAADIAGQKGLKMIVLQKGDADLPPGVQTMKELVANEDTSCLESVKRTPDDIALLPYSSGTTGRPKGVVLTNRNITANLYALARAREHKDRTGSVREVIPLILPMFHIYGFAIASVTLLTGGELILLPKFEEESFLNSLKEATILYVAPPLVLYLSASPRVTADTLKTLKTVVSGAAPVGGSDIKRLEKKLTPDCIYKQGYGLTETSPVICTTPITERNPTSVGPPVVNTRVKIVDLQTSQALGPNESGEIVVSGPQVMREYWKNQKATDEVLRDGWFYTGDIGHYDERGFFYITDRLKELIKVKGFQVAPAELEEVLRSHPSVADAGVVAAPDPLKGEKPVAFVALKPGIPQDPEPLKAFIREKVAKFKQINDFIFVESIPKSAAGKILRKELRKKVAENISK